VCGRYVSHLPPEEIARLFGTVNPLPNIVPTWNLAPSQDALVVRRHPQTGQRHLDVLRWGLLPHFTKDPEHARRPINARAETVATSGMFRSALADRRCLVPASAFYEWKPVRGGPKQPYAITRSYGLLMAFAGLWEGWRGPDGAVERTFAIVTTYAGPDVMDLHDRMPVIVEPEDWPMWLGEADGDPAALLHPPPEGTLRIWPVSRKVNRPANNGRELLDRVDGSDTPEQALSA
jgi:putative SOS response-associated peptidase YedK